MRPRQVWRNGLQACSSRWADWAVHFYLELRELLDRYCCFQHYLMDTSSVRIPISKFDGNDFLLFRKRAVGILASGR